MFFFFFACLLFISYRTFGIKTSQENKKSFKGTLLWCFMIQGLLLDSVSIFFPTSSFTRWACNINSFILIFCLVSRFLIIFLKIAISNYFSVYKFTAISRKKFLSNLYVRNVKCYNSYFQLHPRKQNMHIKII